MGKRTLSVIISTKNEADNLPRLLKSLTATKIAGLEIIIIDNFSTDKTQQIAQVSGARFYQHGYERSSQRNFGAKKAIADYLLFLDADMEIPRQVLLEILILIKQKPDAAVIPETNSGKTWFGKIKQLEKQIYLNEPLMEAPRLFNKKFFQKIDGYNAGIIAGEDWDIRNRFSGIGKITRTKSCLIHHENSLIRELKHKMYYAKLIRKYQQLHSDDFSKLSGKNRLDIFWKKRKLLFRHPLEAVGLIFVKSLEYCIFQATQLIE